MVIMRGYIGTGCEGGMRMRLWWCALLWLLSAGPAVAQICDPKVPHEVLSARFTVAVEGTVTDLATGLTWMRCPVGREWDGTGCGEGKAWYVMHAWDDAMRTPVSTQLQRFGLDDWRVPTREELATLVEPACSNPATNLELFPDTPSVPFWTATATGGGDAYAVRIDFKNGLQQAELKLTSSFQVRLVRGTFRPLPLKVVPVEAVAPLPFDDGIHDPSLAALDVLQRPEEAMAAFPKTSFGRVDWGKSLQIGLIDPRISLDGGGSMNEFNLNIVMPKTRDMPYVSFPHSSHTQWLECSNCHPAIFVPRLGANPITMGGILQGEFCGACHGRVAFSAFECERCHDVMHKGSPDRWW